MAPDKRSAVSPATAPSPARLAANRSNAQLSTGPRSTEGKSIASGNATRHGVLSTRSLLRDEKPEEFHALTTALHGSLRPSSAIEDVLVDQVVGIIWRLRRASRVETSLLAGGGDAILLAAAGQDVLEHAIGIAFGTQAATFNVLTRYETALVNRLRLTLSDLEHKQEIRTRQGQARTPRKSA